MYYIFKNILQNPMLQVATLIISKTILFYLCKYLNRYQILLIGKSEYRNEIFTRNPYVNEMPVKVTPVWIYYKNLAWENLIRSPLYKYINGILLAKQTSVWVKRSCDAVYLNWLLFLICSSWVAILDSSWGHFCLHLISFQVKFECDYLAQSGLRICCQFLRAVCSVNLCKLQ